MDKQNCTLNCIINKHQAGKTDFCNKKKCKPYSNVCSIFQNGIAIKIKQTTQTITQMEIIPFILIYHLIN